jgi:hypothetical protein
MQSTSSQSPPFSSTCIGSDFGSISDCQPLQLSPYSCTNPWLPLRKEKLAKISVGGWEISCLPSPDSVLAAAECGVGSGRKIPDYALLHSSHPIKAQKNRVLQIWPMDDDAHYGPAGPSSM